MDTHIANAPDLDQVGAPLGSPVRLPGARGTLPHPGSAGDEAALEAGIPAAPDPASTAEQGEAAPPRPSGRKGLLATVAIVLLAGAGGATWAVQQGIVVLPPQVSALLRPAGTPAGAQATAEVGVAANQAQAPTAAATPTAAGPASPPANSLHMNEFAALKPHEGPAEIGVSATRSTPAKGSDTTSGPSGTGSVAAKADAGLSPGAAEANVAATTLVVLPVVTTMPPSSELPASSIAHDAAAASPPATAPAQTLASPATPTSASAPAEAPVVTPVKPRDPVQVAATLHAAPLAPKQQVETVGLVRELGAQLMETRLLVTQLGATVAELKQQVETRTTEFDGRLTLAEAGTVLARSAQAGKPLQAPPASAAAPMHQTALDRSAGPASPHAGAAATRSVKDFRIQGASPGLVVLNVLNPAAGEAPVLYLALGEPVPGLGRVKSIYQRGTSWLVQTDAGVIQ